MRDNKLYAFLAHDNATQGHNRKREKIMVHNTEGELIDLHVLRCGGGSINPVTDIIK